MATFFGEVILPSSRAFFDDDGDSDSENDNGQDNKSSDNLVKCMKGTVGEDGIYDIFVITDGSLAKDFVKNYLKGDKSLVCEFEEPANQEVHQETGMIYSKKFNTKSSIAASLWHLDSNLLHLESSTNLQLKHANQLTLLLGGWLEKCNEVIILASRSRSEYRSDKSECDNQTFVRSLASSVSSIPTTASPMEQPNFITGLAASVMSWCEVKRIKCLLHVCYTDALFSDSATLAPLLNSLSDSSLAAHIHRIPPSQLKCDNPHHLDVMYQ